MDLRLKALVVYSYKSYIYLVKFNYVFLKFSSILSYRLVLLKLLDSILSNRDLVYNAKKYIKFIIELIIVLN